MDAHVAKSVIENAYLQGGAVLLLVVLLVLSVIGIFRYIVKPLWDENKALRGQVMDMNERVAKMGEASRLTNEKAAEVLREQNTTLREILVFWRTKV